MAKNDPIIIPISQVSSPGLHANWLHGDAGDGVRSPRIGGLLALGLGGELTLASHVKLLAAKRH